MKKLGALLVTVGAAVGSSLPLLGPAAVAAPTTDRYLVQFEDGTDPDVAATALRAVGVEVVEVYRDVFAGVAVRADSTIVDQLRREPLVARVEPDQVITLDAASSFSPTIVTQTGPSLSWGLDRIDQRSLPLSNSYSYNGAGAGVTAYIVDSGIRADHVDFGGRVRSGFTTVFDGFGTDDCGGGGTGHGTHVAGIVGGQTFGVAKSVSLVAVRVLDCGGSTSTSEFVNALDWVIADHPAGAPAVVNISIGGPPSLAVDNSVQSLVNDGITVVVAAGNAQTMSLPVDACLGSPARAPARSRSPPPTRSTLAPRSRTSVRVSICSLLGSISVGIQRLSDGGGGWGAARRWPRRMSAGRRPCSSRSIRRGRRRRSHGICWPTRPSM